MEPTTILTSDFRMMGETLQAVMAGGAGACQQITVQGRGLRTLSKLAGRHHNEIDSGSSTHPAGKLGLIAIDALESARETRRFGFQAPAPRISDLIIRTV